MCNIHFLFKLITAILVLVALFAVINHQNHSKLPLVAIANYGPHSSLDDAIDGIKEELAAQGFIEHETVRFEVADVGFDTSLIPQMITQLNNKHPDVLITVATPVAQYAKAAIKDSPIIYSVITDPIDAGLIKEPDAPYQNITGSSDKQNLEALLQFTKKTLPNAKRIGILYGTGESNDLTLLKMMKDAAQKENMMVVSIPVDSARDIAIRMQGFKDKVDFIYVGASGPIQPALPAISYEANKMKIPVINVNQNAVEIGLVFASFGVNYKRVGANAGKLASEVLKGVPIELLTPLYPTLDEHCGYINQTKANELGITLPDDLTNITVLE